MNARPKRTRPSQDELIEGVINKKVKPLNLGVKTPNQKKQLYRQIENMNQDFALAIGFEEKHLPMKFQYSLIDNLENNKGTLIAHRHPTKGLHTMLVIKENDELYAFDPNHDETWLTIGPDDFFYWFFNDYKKSRNIKIHNVMTYRTTCMQENFPDGACSVIGSNLRTMYYKVNANLGRGEKPLSNGLDKLYEYMTENKTIIDVFAYNVST